MLTWILSQPAAAGAVAIMAVFAIVSALLGMDWVRRKLEAREATDSEHAGAPEGANPTVRMPRFR